MSHVSPFVFLNDKIVPEKEAHISIASSAILYGLSVYTVAFAKKTDNGFLCFRLEDHFTRLMRSAAMIGMRSALDRHTYTAFKDAVALLIQYNKPNHDVFVRATIHATSTVAGVRTADVETTMSIFLYEARPILPQDGAILKTSLWRRTCDDAIPARAKVNGAYVNSCLAKQDALDAGADDALFLNHSGFVSELTAANIFLVRDNILITPDAASDILEGITRRTLIDEARKENIPVCERRVALTELYTADEVFACGTSTFVAPITHIDHRAINKGMIGPLTQKMRDTLFACQSTSSPYTTLILL